MSEVPLYIGQSPTHLPMQAALMKKVDPWSDEDKVAPNPAPYSPNPVAPPFST